MNILANVFFCVTNKAVNTFISTWLFLKNMGSIRHEGPLLPSKANLGPFFWQGGMYILQKYDRHMEQHWLNFSSYRIANGLLQLWHLIWRWVGSHLKPFRGYEHSLHILVRLRVIDVIYTSESVDPLMSELMNLEGFLGRRGLWLLDRPLPLPRPLLLTSM